MLCYSNFLTFLQPYETRKAKWKKEWEAQQQAKKEAEEKAKWIEYQNTRDPGFMENKAAFIILMISIACAILALIWVCCCPFRDVGMGRRVTKATTNAQNESSSIPVQTIVDENDFYENCM